MSLSFGEDLEYEPDAVCGRARTFERELEVPPKVGGALVSGMFARDDLRVGGRKVDVIAQAVAPYLVYRRWANGGNGAFNQQLNAHYYSCICEV